MKSRDAIGLFRTGLGLRGIPGSWIVSSPVKKDLAIVLNFMNLNMENLNILSIC